MNLEYVSILLLAFLVLIKSANFSIKRVIRLARHYEISEYLVSFVLVGTISIFPELAIGISSALEGSSSFGLGIVFGSNVMDLTLIIGLVVLMANTLKLKGEVLQQTPLLFATVALPVVLLLDGEISRFDGLLLLAAFAYYIYTTFKSKENHAPIQRVKPKILVSAEIGMLVIGLIVLFASGHVITEAAVHLSSQLAVPLFFLGTLLAIGTCMPELSVAASASKGKHAELGFGDVLGNVFADCTATIGIIALISPIRPHQPLLAISGGISMIVALLVLIALFNHTKTISKTRGMILVLLYVFFLISQLVIETQFTPAL